MGGKTSEESVEIDEGLRKDAEADRAMAERIAKLGYQPNRGVTIAALTPMQEDAMRSTGRAASAFGLGGGDPLAGMPLPETSASGIRGYSTGADYDQMVGRLPAQYRSNIDAFFTGADENIHARQKEDTGGKGKGGSNERPRSSGGVAGKPSTNWITQLQSGRLL